MDVALVFGAGGFLGRRVAETLGATPGLRVVESDLAGRAAEGTVAGLAAGGPSAGGHDFVPLDLAWASPESIARELAAAGATVVVNCAGRTSGAEPDLRVANVQTVARLLAAIELMPARPRLVHIGSAAEYGPAPFGVPVTEGAVPAPASAYGATKLEATRLVCEASTRGSVEGLVLRVFNAVGPGMPEGSLTGAAVRRLRQALESGANEIQMGPLQAIRDFVDVRDIAAAVAAACRSSWGVAVVNVGTGQAHTSRELVEALARRIGYRGAIAEEAPGSERSVDVPWMVADVSLAERLLGWRAVHDLDSIADGVVAARVDRG